MLLGWIIASIVLIGLGSNLAGDYHADYNTPGSQSKQASDLSQRAFKGYSGQEIYVVWKDPKGAQSPGAKQSMDKFFAQAEKVQAHRPARADPRLRTAGSRRRRCRSTSRLGSQEKQGEELIDAAEASAGARPMSGPFRPGRRTCPFDCFAPGL